MTYIRTNKAHTHHEIEQADGSIVTKYNNRETGYIAGKYRDMTAVLADNTGFDGLGFDASVGSNDDSWHVVNVFENGGSYLDSMAIGGASDAEHAQRVATAQLDHLGGDYYCTLIADKSAQFDGMDGGNDTWSIDAIAKLMNNPSQDKHYIPLVTAQELSAEAARVTFDSVEWDGAGKLISHGGKDSLLALDLVRADSLRELDTPYDLPEALALVDAVEEDSFDALMETKTRLELLKSRLYKALVEAGDTPPQANSKDAPATVPNANAFYVTDVTVTKPFKSRGMLNVVFLFTLSDGQTISIWFHNPDSTPMKLLPSDIMISWKWLLNKRDVTAALSPKSGDNVQLPTLAKKMMRVARANSKRFKSAQMRSAAAESALIATQKLIEDKHATIKQLDIDIENLNKQIDAAMKASKAEKPKKAAGDIFSEGDAVIWISNGREISRGVFVRYVGTGGDRIGVFTDDGGNMNAPASELVFDTDATTLTDEQINAQEQARQHSSIEALIADVEQSKTSSFNKWDMTMASVAALSEEHFLRLSDALAHARMYGNEQLLNAYRTGNQSLVNTAQTINDNQKSSGELTPEISSRRDNLWVELRAALNLEEPSGARTAIKPKPVDETVDDVEVGDNDAPATTTTIPVREALDYLATTIFKGQTDKELMYAVDENGAIVAQSMIKARSKASATRFTNKHLHSDNVDEIRVARLTDDNLSAARQLEGMGYVIDYSDPDNFTTDDYEVGDVYMMKRRDVFGANASDPSGEIAMEFSEWLFLRRGEDEAKLKLNTLSGANSVNLTIKQMDAAVKAGARLMLKSEVDKLREDEKTVFIASYVNSKGRVLATVTKSGGSYDVKGEGSATIGAKTEAAVLNSLEAIKARNPSMKFKEGTDFFASNKPEDLAQKANAAINPDVVITEGESAEHYLFNDDSGNPKKFSDVIKSTELLAEFDMEIETKIAEREENVLDILIGSLGWENADNISRDAKQWEYTKNGHMMAIDFIKNPIPEGGNDWGNRRNQTISWEFTTSDFKHADMLDTSDMEMARIINNAANEQVTNLGAVNEDILLDIFLKRNKDKPFVLGMDKGDTEANNDNVFEFVTGILAGKTVRYADSLCKLIDGAKEIGADIAISDFDATAYQHSMFDALTSQSNPIYGITAQIAKDGVVIARAGIDKNGDCLVFIGSSGESVQREIRFTPADNINIYATALLDALQIAFNKQAEKNMSQPAPVIEPTAAPVKALEPIIIETPVIPDDSAVQKMKVYEDQINAADFNPVTFDMDGFMALINEVAGSDGLTDHITEIANTYQRKLIEVTQSAMSGLAGGA